MTSNKLFLTKLNELEGRLDPFCYIPELVELDRLVKSRTTYRLRDFAKSYAGGSTPHKDHSDEYYTTKESGVPFLRVQNLSTSGELNFDNLIYVTPETHNGLLKRSRVLGGDLLVKITGVGRMAVASVAPDGFEGNINQHIVVIRTGSAELSRQLAAFLNLDSIEKIASKRATGATRPALDYPALFSIPVIADASIAERIQIAVSAKKSKEAEAQALLDSIDDYLLAELGINLPKKSPNTLTDRMFIRPASSLVGTRWDAFYFQEHFYALMDGIERSKIPVVKLKQELVQLYNGFDDRQTVEFGSPYLKVANIRPYEINPTEGQCIDSDVPERVKLKAGDILLTRKGTFGVAARATEACEGYTICSEIFKLRFSSNVQPEYMEAVLNSSICQRQFDRIKIGAIMGSLTQDVVLQVQIPLPAMEKQQAVAEQISKIRAKAKQLRDAAVTGLTQAKAEVEKMILGIA